MYLLYHAGTVYHDCFLYIPFFIFSARLGTGVVVLMAGLALLLSHVLLFV